MLIDSHFHCWRLSRGDYGWLTPSLGRLHRDVSIADWRAVAQPHGVVAGVLVQAAPTEAETAFLLEQAASDPAVLGVVGWVDLLGGDATRRIERMAAQPKLKGLRPMLQDIADPRWILQPALAPALDAMALHGLVFDALIRPPHLPHILALAERHPTLPIVIDHGAKPDIAGGQWIGWADELARVARQTRAVCKLSGLLTEAGAAASPDAARRWARHVLDSFGPERVLWGSDWPVLELAGSYAGWFDETMAVLEGCSEQERAALLGGNAKRVYRL